MNPSGWSHGPQFRKLAPTLQQRALRSMRKAPLRQDITRAPAGTCQYLVRGENGQQAECGAAAAWQNRKSEKIYCDAHGQHVSRSTEVIALKAGHDGRRETLKPFNQFKR